MNDRLTDTDKRKAIAIVAGSRAIGVFCGSVLGGLLLEGLVTLLVAVVWESKARHPLLDVTDLFGYGLGVTPLTASFLFLPMTLAGTVAAKAVPSRVVRTSPGPGLVAGGLIKALSFVWLRFDRRHTWAFAVGILVHGFAYTTLMTTSVSVIAHEAEDGRGTGTASLYVAVALSASSLGAALYAAIVAGNADQATGAPTAGAHDVGLLVAAAAGFVALLAGLVLRPGGRVEVTAGH